MPPESVGAPTFLSRFVRFPLVDQEAIAQHLSRGEQKQLADWLDANTPAARRKKLRALKSRLDKNSSALRNQTLRAVARGRLTSATHASLEAHLSPRTSASTVADTGATGWTEQALP